MEEFETDYEGTEVVVTFDPGWCEETEYGSFGQDPKLVSVKYAATGEDVPDLDRFDRSALLNQALEWHQWQIENDDSTISNYDLWG